MTEFKEINGREQGALPCKKILNTLYRSFWSQGVKLSKMSCTS